MARANISFQFFQQPGHSLVGTSPPLDLCWSLDDPADDMMLPADEFPLSLTRCSLGLPCCWFAEAASGSELSAVTHWDALELGP